jgi:sec-independent protein translocase protein TatB
MDFFGIGFGEILLIVIVALIVMGPQKMPGVARTIGKTIAAFKKASSDLTSQVTSELEIEEKRSSEANAKEPLDEGHKVEDKPDNKS